MTAPKREAMMQAVSDALTGLKPYFVGQVELTFFARHTENPKAHVLVSNDSPELITAAIMDLAEQPDMELIPPGPRDLCDYNSFFYDCRDHPCADCPSREEHLELEDPTDFIDDEEALEVA